MKKLNFTKGRKAENTAKEFLESLGYVFVEANYHNDIGEIDLIMSDKDWLVFVEVKYKSDDSQGTPEEMVNRKKLGQVKRVAEMYLLTNYPIREKFVRYRIDAVCILRWEIRHYKNIGT